MEEDNSPTEEAFTTNKKQVKNATLTYVTRPTFQTDTTEYLTRTDSSVIDTDSMRDYNQATPSTTRTYRPTNNFPRPLMATDLFVNEQSPQVAVTRGTMALLAMSEIRLRDRYPIHISCPHCSTEIVTMVIPKRGCCSYMGCILMSFICCCLLPLYLPSFQDWNHVCPFCNQLIGTAKVI